MNQFDFFYSLLFCTETLFTLRAFVIYMQCPICQDSLEGGQREAVTFCFTCGNNVHSACIKMWVDSRRRQSLEVSCPFCRSCWMDGKNPPKANPRATGQAAGEYVNLGNLSEAHRNGDTSLEALYGDRSIWIEANQGTVSRRVAASYWQTMHGR